MLEFSLSKRPEKVLKTYVEDNGICYDIETDYRTILRILRMMDDPDIERRHKIPLVLSWFYKGDIPPEPLEVMFEWLSTRKKRRDPSAPPMDYEFDADVIYASFRMRYGIDLLRVEYLHWHEFCVLMEGINGETPFGMRLEARGRDTKKLKGKERQSAEIARANAQIPKRESRAQQEYHQRLTQALMNGEDISGLV